MSSKAHSGCLPVTSRARRGPVTPYPAWENPELAVTDKQLLPRTFFPSGLTFHPTTFQIHCRINMAMVVSVV